jgi:hypothetical protein
MNGVKELCSSLNAQNEIHITLIIYRRMEFNLKCVSAMAIKLCEISRN